VAVRLHEIVNLICLRLGYNIFRRHGLDEVGSRLCEFCRKLPFSLFVSESTYHQRNKIGCRLVALLAKIGLFGGAFINNLRRRNRPRSLVNTGIVSLKAEKVHFSATKSAS
jgi:hypothetical protein